MLLPNLNFKLVVVLASLHITSAFPSPSKSSSKGIYYLTNCFLSTNISIQDAEIDYYTSKPKSFPTAKSRLVAVINPTESLDYEDCTVSTLAGSSFNLTVVIGEDAYTAKAGDVVGSASGSSVKGKLKCVRLERVVLYESGNIACYSDYACA